ncbi:MAG: ATP-binding cassette domain-containing protein [Atopobiaceae bacterium]|nr:ATP-binding cassette domain-containing protein [Atopobiaceae bacterium]
MQRSDNAAATLCTILAFYGRHVPMEEVRGICPASRNGTPVELLCEAATAYQLECNAHDIGIDEMKALDMPVVALWNRRYYTVVKGFRRGLVFVSDPAKGEYEITEEKFRSMYAGKVITMTPGPEFKKGGHPESLSKLLAKRLGNLKGDLTKMLFINIVTVLLSMAFVEGTRLLLDEDTAEQPTYLVWMVIIAEAVILLVYTVLAIRKTMLVNDTSRRAAAKSGSELFKHIFRLPMRFFDQISAGELIQRMENNARLDRTLILSTIPRVIDAITASGYLALMLSYNPIVALSCLAVEIVYLLAMSAQRKVIALQARSMTTSSGSLNASILNGMGTIETINATGTERVFFHMWRETQADYQENSLQNLQLNAVTQAITGTHGMISSAVLLFVGAHLMAQGRFDMASLAATQMVVGRMGSSLGNCLNTLNSLQSVRTNIERVEDLNRREACPEITLDESDDHGKLRGSLDVSHVCFRYNPGDPLALTDISFNMTPGQVFAIVGKSGCGKSTLLKLIADLYTPSSGEIRYGGKRRDEVPDVVFRSSVTTVDQEIVMFEDTVSENLRMWDDTIENYAMILSARDAQIHERIANGPDGYQALIHENGKGFSGGELQRLELARALEVEPTILLLDEFTSALDALTEEKVIQAIRSLDVTSIIVAHRLSTIRDADQIIVLDKGHIAAQGTHEELFESCQLYHDMVSTE